tara:strand:+ start:59 stop:361 length:303 start_codon:yes stop_codon:yes gene_type:complete
MKNYKHIIYFALSKKINLNDQMNKILKKVVETFNGYSLIKMKGGYLDKETNKMIEETSYKLEILQDTKTKDIKYLCKYIKDIAKQKEVYFTTQKIKLNKI